VNLSRCDHCGQTDDHPKVVVADGLAGARFHHDCLGSDLRASLIESSDKAQSIIEAAEAGTHGDDLRRHIAAIHQD
jgi:hypothetical protein